MSAATFRTDLAAFARVIEQRSRAVFAESATHVHRSIKDGSATTGAPGQPVDSGDLKRSWNLIPEGPMQALVATKLEYAPAIEDGIGPHGPMSLRSAVGGFHSVKITVAGAQRIVDEAVKTVNA